MPEYISGSEGAYHVMRWFQKDRPPNLREFAADRPLGDIGAAQKIREICASAGSIAETMATLRGSKAEAHKVSEAERRYQAAVKCALELAKQISDDAMRDVTAACLSVEAAWHLEVTAGEGGHGRIEALAWPLKSGTMLHSALIAPTVRLGLYSALYPPGGRLSSPLGPLRQQRKLLHSPPRMQLLS